ncbi:MAG: sodium:solute symporter family protein [Terriglobales bacterium]
MLIAIVLLYFASMGALGFALKKRNKTASDFLIAGRKLGIVLTTATLAGVQIGAGIVLGSAETGAQSGLWPGTWYGLGCGFGLILAGLLVASRLRSVDGFVPLDFFARRYGESRWVRLWAWACNIPSLLGIFVAQVMAAAYVLSIFGFPYHYALVLVGCVILIYCILGGMWAIASSSLIQVVILFVGIPVATLMTLFSVHDPGLVEKIVSQPFIPPGMGSKFVFLILPFLLSISISYDAYLRYQSAASGRVARWGCIGAGLIVIFITLCTALIGAAGRLIFPKLPASFVLPHVIQARMHPVLAGIVVAALLGAAMSSGTGVLISLAGCFSRDFYNKVLHPNQELDELKHGNTVARSVIVLTLLVGLLIAFRASNILFTIIILNYPYMGSMLVPLLGGVLWRSATPQGARAAMVVGGTIGVAAFVAGIPGRFQGFMNYNLGLLIAWLASTLVFVIVSLITAKRVQEI